MSREITGRITMIQEERIRMLDDEGRAFLLTLAQDAETEDLKELHRSNARVRVEYEGEPDLDTGIVRAITRIPGPVPGETIQAMDSLFLSEGSGL